MKLSLVFLGGTLALAGGVAGWGLLQEGPGGAGVFALSVLGPEGPLIEDSIEAEGATALSVLEIAAGRHDLPLVIERYTGMGAYVRAIGAHRAAGATGWLYDVERDGAWLRGDRSAEDFPLQKGDALRWSWTAG